MLAVLRQRRPVAREHQPSVAAGDLESEAGVRVVALDVDGRPQVDRIAGPDPIDLLAAGADDPAVGDPRVRVGDRGDDLRRHLGQLVVGALEHRREVDVVVVLGDHVGRADRVDLAVVQEQRPLAVLGHDRHRVGDQQDRAARPVHVLEDLAAALLELGVADREDLVDQQHVGVDVRHHREAEPDLHSRGVVLDLEVDVVLQARELDDLVESAPRLGRAQSHHHAVQDDVVAGGQLRVEADAELEEGGEAAGDLDRPAVGRVDAREQLQQGALAGAVAADDPEELALGDVEAEVVEDVERATGRAAERVAQASAQGRGRPATGNVEPLAEPADLDGGRPLHAQAGLRHQAPTQSMRSIGAVMPCSAR